MKLRTKMRKLIKVHLYTHANIMETSVIELKGEPIESFERVSKIKEIILLGEDGEIRRIILK